MNKISPLFLTISLALSGVIIALGSWWIYLLSKFGRFLEESGKYQQAKNLENMVKWEGITFLIIILLLIGALLILYLKDQKKSRSLNAFYAGMTHELKTPLASIRLQAEVLQEATAFSPLKQNELTQRLIESCNKLETQMDKVLQLSRIEGGGNFNLSPIEIAPFIQSSLKRWAPKLELTVEEKENGIKTVYADELALDLILRNLFENTLNHSPKKQASIHLTRGKSTQMLSIHYQDHGHFKGDPKRIGHLFYKHDSPKGSGIGLYLIKKLTEKMGGDFQIKLEPLAFMISLHSPEEGVLNG